MREFYIKDLFVIFSDHLNPKKFLSGKFEDNFLLDMTCLRYEIYVSLYWAQRNTLYEKKNMKSLCLRLPDQ